MSIAPRQLIFYITLLLGAFLAQTSLASASSSTNDIAVRQLVEKNLPSLITYYTTLHAAPELSHQEAHTAEGIAQELRFAGFEVIEHIGKYESSKLKPSGVAGVLKNGPGPTVLIRADMDALPIEEKTGLPYASTRRMTADSGVEVPVMHACGHDIHVTSLVGVARVMSKLKNNWHGTLVLMASPPKKQWMGRYPYCTIIYMAASRSRTLLLRCMTAQTSLRGRSRSRLAIPSRCRRKWMSRSVA